MEGTLANKQTTQGTILISPELFLHHSSYHHHHHDVLVTIPDYSSPKPHTLPTPTPQPPHHPPRRLSINVPLPHPLSPPHNKNHQPIHIARLNDAVVEPLHLPAQLPFQEGDDGFRVQPGRGGGCLLVGVVADEGVGEGDLAVGEAFLL